MSIATKTKEERLAELRAIRLKGDDGIMELVEILSRHMGYPQGTHPGHAFLYAEIIAHEYPDDPSLPLPLA
jgi:hypothetical protein